MNGCNSSNTQIPTSESTVGPQNPLKTKELKRTRTKVNSRFNEVFREFFRNSKTRDKTPKLNQVKLEYVSAKLIRGVKKAMRESILKKLPRGKIHKFNRSDPASQALWNALSEKFRSLSNIQELSSTKSDPSSQDCTYKSFSRPYVREFFSNFDPEIFKDYVDLIFFKESSGDLCKKFELMCCSDGEHRGCWAKWAQVKNWLKDEFIQELKSEAEGKKPEVPKVELTPKEDPFKAMLSRLGFLQILWFLKLFKCVSSCGVVMNQYVFARVMKYVGANIPEIEIQLGFAKISTDNSGNVTYQGFLEALQMNGLRKASVKEAFSKLDTNQSGQVRMVDIPKGYNAQGHPCVVKKKREPDEVLEEFLRTFEIHHVVRGAHRGVVTYQDFEDYYNCVSCTIKRDEEFVSIIRGTWKEPDYTIKTQLTQELAFTLSNLA